MAHNASMTCCSGSECATNTSDAQRIEKTPKSTFRPAVDVLDAGDAYRIVADLPGSSAEGVRITFEDGVLTLDADAPARTPEGAQPIRSEYGVGDYHRRFRVHGEVDAEGITASYAAGVLTVTLPKPSKALPRRIPVSAN
ncbi:MAG: Hsp20/alpha crystallin family protein [Phycisphaerales bacterium]